MFGPISNPITLPNFGNSCWLNSTIQALAEPLSTVGGKFSKSPVATLCNLVSGSSTNLPSEQEIKKHLTDVRKLFDENHFPTGVVNDVGLAIEHLIDLFSDDLDPVFGIHDSRIYECSACGYQSTHANPASTIMYLAPNPQHSTISVWDMICKNLTRQSGDHVELFKTCTCQKPDKSPQTITTVLRKLSRVLVFGCRGLKDVPKNVPVSYPTEIDMGLLLEDTSVQNVQKYSLHSIVEHQGDDKSGHYLAHVKRNGCWHSISDSNSRPVNDVSRLHPAFVVYVADNTTTIHAPTSTIPAPTTTTATAASTKKKKSANTA